MQSHMAELVHCGFRPSNLPPKSTREKELHQAHVRWILGQSTRDDGPALDEFWQTELLIDACVTDQMKRLWGEYGLPSLYVRRVLWPSCEVVQCESTSMDIHEPTPLVCLHVQCDCAPVCIHRRERTCIAESTRRLIESDVSRTCTLGRSAECIFVLENFAAKFPELNYTQGMSYVCFGILRGLGVGCDLNQCLSCMEHVLVESPMVRCMYRLDRLEIGQEIEFILDTLCVLNFGPMWEFLHTIPQFSVLDWFLLEWILTMFVKSFTKDISNFVFDQFFLSGDIALFKAVVCALEIIISPDTQKTHTNDEIRSLFFSNLKIHNFSLFKQKFHQIYVPHGLFKYLQNSDDVR